MIKLNDRLQIIAERLKDEPISEPTMVFCQYFYYRVDSVIG